MKPGTCTQVERSDLWSSSTVIKCDDVREISSETSRLSTIVLKSVNTIVGPKLVFCCKGVRKLGVEYFLFIYLLSGER